MVTKDGERDPTARSLADEPEFQEIERMVTEGELDMERTLKEMESLELPEMDKFEIDVLGEGDGMTETATADAPEVLTVDQAAGFLQVSRATLYRLIKDGEIHGRRVSGRWRFTKRSLLAWIDSQQD